MALKRLLGRVVPVVFLASSVLAQVNELSVTAGRAFVSTQTVYNTGLTGPTGAPYNPPLHFGNEETIAFNYSRLLKTLWGSLGSVRRCRWPSIRGWI